MKYIFHEIVECNFYHQNDKFSLNNTLKSFPNFVNEYKDDLIKYPEYKNLINEIIIIKEKEKEHINYIILYVS